MKLFLLKPIFDMDNGTTNPWCPWYDKVHGFVIRAKDEQQARQIATENGRAEIAEYSTEGRVDAWLNPKLSTCVELSRKGEAEILIMDSRNS